MSGEGWEKEEGCGGWGGGGNGEKEVKCYNGRRLVM